MKTLYVSDLDGTLLRSNARTSEQTNEIINQLTARGMLFTYATARSVYTAAKATAGLTARIPIITYNGALVLENLTGEILLSHFFTAEEAAAILDDLLRQKISPIVYAYDGREHFSYLNNKLNRRIATFLESRKNDPRSRPVSCRKQLLQGQVYYFTCIDDAEKMCPLYERYRERYHCFFQPEIYSGDTFFEIIPKSASKAAAVLQLKEKLRAQRVVAFGDGENDIDLFQIADETYAVSNASEKLKAAATGVIGSNDEDSVATWLEAHAGF